MIPTAPPVTLTTPQAHMPVKRARLIAFYLPQFHPIPENDEWWGKGFTEWTNVAKAKPLFPGHYQPHIPADLGFYDLRLPEVRAAQAELAEQHGLEGFCYWHYWFAGKRLLELPFNQVLHSGEPRLPFCLAWANDSWSGIWYGAPNRILIQQTYPGLDDHKEHFYGLLDAFGDDRYIKVDGKPLFAVYKPRQLPDSKRVTDFWRELAHRSGIKGLYLVGVTQSDSSWIPTESGFDAVTINNQTKIGAVAFRGRFQSALKRVFHGRDALYFISSRLVHYPLHIYEYRDALRYFLDQPPAGVAYHPCLVPNWDNTPRTGFRGAIFCHATPDLFRQHVRKALDSVADQPDESRIVFIKSWNEWAEGNYLEPDQLYGRGHLQVLRDEVCSS